MRYLPILRVSFFSTPPFPVCEGQEPAAQNEDDSKPFKRLGVFHKEY